MSYINVWKAETSESVCEINLPSLQKQDEDRSFTDGEELMAASAIIDMIDDLDNGQAIVITKVVF